MEAELHDNWSDLSTYLYWAASKCTDPICYLHENWRRYQVGAQMSSPLALISYSLFSIPGAVAGATLRWIATHLQNKPYTYFKIDGNDQELPENEEFSHLSWNICCVGAGYTISDGGVIPWRDRIDQIVEQIVTTNADVNSLYETFDTDSAFYLCEKLKTYGYNHFVFNIGPNTIGTTSGIFIASKYRIANLEFTPYPKESLIGRTKSCNKGVFQFDLVSKDRNFATILSTHLQHSEEPEFPTSQEVAARTQQMELVSEKVKRVVDKLVVVTGDLNLDDEEYENSSWKKHFDKAPLSEGQKTWGGDEFCARLVAGGKRVSKALNLDHTLVTKDSGDIVSNSLVKTGYDAKVFNPKALSDHEGVLTKFALKKIQESSDSHTKYLIAV